MHIRTQFPESSPATATVPCTNESLIEPVDCSIDTVNGRNPAAPWMDVIDNGISHLSTGGGFIPSTVCWTLLDYHGMTP